MLQMTTTVLRNEPYASDYQELVLDCEPITAAVLPGQFVHIRVPKLDTAVLRRPFSVFRAQDNELTILYKVIGLGTRAMTSVNAGDAVNLIGPCGRGFPLETNGAFPVLVAGGYGVAPLCMLAANLPTQGALFAGAAGKQDILCIDAFKDLGWETHVATEDGSLGEKGLVTDILDSWMAGREDAPPIQFYACGPDGMLRAVGDRAETCGHRAWLSLDKHMGCGVGACLACVQRLRKPDGTEHWGRVCREGPVFDSREIVWQ